MTFTQIVGNLVFILLLVFANGFFVAAEFAIVKVRSTQIASKLRAGHRRAAMAKHMVDHLDAYLSATQLGITFASLALGWAGEPVLAVMLEGPLKALGIENPRTIQAVSFSVSFAILTFLHIVLGELAPKSLAIRYPESTTLFVSLPLRFFYRVFSPAIFLLNNAANFILRKVGIPPSSTSELLHSAEELEMIVREGAASGVLNKTEEELITSIFQFSGKIARDIMVPRTGIVAIGRTMPREKLLTVVVEEGYSRMPVYDESIDRIIGIIHSKDLLSLREHGDLIVIDDIIRPAHFVPGTVMISRLLRDMQQKKITMSIVVDEFGGTEGLVTIEDILEEIVGEIHDEYDEVGKDFEHLSADATLVDAKVPLREFNEKFHSDLPEDESYDTLGGFLYKVGGRIPELQEVITYKNLQFTVTGKSDRRIDQVKVRELENRGDRNR